MNDMNEVITENESELLEDVTTAVEPEVEEREIADDVGVSEGRDEAIASAIPHLSESFDAATPLDDPVKPISELKELIKSDPDRALERASTLESGVRKLQAQKEEAESFIHGIDSVFQGLERGDRQAIDEFERLLTTHTGLTYRTLVELQNGDTSGFEKARLGNLERKLAEIEQDRAATKWISEIGSVVAQQVAKETGLEFSPQQLWNARSHLPQGATSDDVRKAVMKADPDAYDQAVAKRDGPKSPVPRSATMPTGRGGTRMSYEHTPQGFLQAYEAKKARGL